MCIVGCRFLPSSHADFVPVLLSEKGEFSTPKGKKEKAGASVCRSVCCYYHSRQAHLPLAWLLVALDGYALAAAATKQASFRTLARHKHWVQEVAAGAPPGVDGGLLAAHYDELVRYSGCLCLWRARVSA